MSSTSPIAEAGEPARVVPAPNPVRLASVVGFLVFTELASGLTQGWIVPLLPSFVERYGQSPAAANWITAAAYLSTVVCVPLLGKLGDLYGHKRMLVIATSLVALGSVIVAIAPTFAVLLAGRVLQGALSAFLPLEFAIVRERAGKRASRAIGWLVGSLTVGGSLGAILAGLASQYLSLAATLWLPAAMMIVVVPFLAWLVPETSTRRTGGVDWVGAALLGAGLALILTAIGNGSRWGWVDAKTLAGVLGGAVLLVAWVRVETRIAHPLVSLDVIRRGRQGLPLFTAFVFGAYLFGSQAPVSSFLATRPAATGFGFGLTGLALGSSLMVVAVAMTLSSAIAARLAERAGQSVVLVGGAAISAVAYLLAIVVRHDLVWFLIMQAGTGIGGGLVAASLPAIVVARAPKDSVGIMSGLYNTSRTAAGSVSGAVFAAVMSAMAIKLSSGKVGASETAYVVVWIICAALALVVAFLSGVLTRARQKIST